MISLWNGVLTVFLVLGSTTDLSLAQWGTGHNPDRVLLTAVQTLTLQDGRMTAARRTSPIPQLTCMGGTAGCRSFVPRAVQCYNRGSDGNDVQWECKTDMDNKYRFGSVEVVCEGYDSPHDPYILKGSCGLEYTLDLTEAGYQKQSEYGQPSYSDPHKTQHLPATPAWLNWIFLVAVAFFVYKIYRSCVAQNQYSTTNSDHPQGPGGYRGGGVGPGGFPQPPPPYPTDNTAFPGESCNAGAQQAPRAGAGGPGFWSGLMGGGALGYLFGRRNPGYGGGMGGMFSGMGGGGYNNYARPSAYNPSYGNSSFGGGGFGGGSSSSGGSGSRSASGFGGTRRR